MLQPVKVLARLFLPWRRATVTSLWPRNCRPEKKGATWLGFARQGAASYVSGASSKFVCPPKRGLTRERRRIIGGFSHGRWRVAGGRAAQSRQSLPA